MDARAPISLHRPPFLFQYYHTVYRSIAWCHAQRTTSSRLVVSSPARTSACQCHCHPWPSHVRFCAWPRDGTRPRPSADTIRSISSCTTPYRKSTSTDPYLPPLSSPGYHHCVVCAVLCYNSVRCLQLQAAARHPGAERDSNVPRAQIRVRCPCVVRSTAGDLQLLGAMANPGVQAETARTGVPCERAARCRESCCCCPMDTGRAGSHVSAGLGTVPPACFRPARRASKNFPQPACLPVPVPAAGQLLAWSGG
jgi:hypothetical protein